MPLRSTIVGAATGALVLAGVVGFAVGLPEVADDEGAATDDASSAGTTPVLDLLPESLLGGSLVRLKDLDPQYEVAGEVEVYGGTKLSEAFGADVATAFYVTPKIETQAFVTLYDGESGLFLQDGPPVPPEMTNGTQPIADVVREGDSVCIAQWDPQSFAEGAAPFQAQCQRVAGGVTVNVYTTSGAAGPEGAITIEQTAEIVDDVVDQAGLAE